jgi:hypothetical protein
MKTADAEVVWKTVAAEVVWDDIWEHMDWKSGFWPESQDQNYQAQFEWEIEAMIRRSIPKDTGPLSKAYGACDWTRTPQNADWTLLEALLHTAVWDRELDPPLVVDRLQDAPFEIRKNGVPLTQPPRPEVELSFARQALDSFVELLNEYAQRTMEEFRKIYASTGDRFPQGVLRLLEGDLLSLTV